MASPRTQCLCLSISTAAKVSAVLLLLIRIGLFIAGCFYVDAILEEHIGFSYSYSSSSNFFSEEQRIRRPYTYYGNDYSGLIEFIPKAYGLEEGSDLLEAICVVGLLYLIVSIILNFIMIHGLCKEDRILINRGLNLCFVEFTFLVLFSVVTAVLMAFNEVISGFLFLFSSALVISLFGIACEVISSRSLTLADRAREEIPPINHA